MKWILSHADGTLIAQQDGSEPLFDMIRNDLPDGKYHIVSERVWLDVVRKDGDVKNDPEGYQHVD